MKFLRIFIIPVMIIAFLSCGRRDDPHYFDCNDGSGSTKCRRLDQGELASYLRSEPDRYDELRFALKSMVSDRVVRDIQSYVIFKSIFRTYNPYSVVYERREERLTRERDEELSCKIESYYGILNEEGSRQSHELEIYGIRRHRKAYWDNCPGGDLVPFDGGEEVLLFSDRNTSNWDY